MLTSIIKTLVGMSVIFLSLYCSVFVLHDAQVVAHVVHYPSLILVMGLLVGITILLVDFRDFGRFAKFLMSYSVIGEKSKLHASEASFEEILQLYTSEGTDAFKTHIMTNNFPKIWQILATKLEIRVPIHDIKTILKFQIKKTISRLDQDITVLRQLTVLAPSLGMFGSVLGLIKLLANMKDFSALGSNMALALIATFYGIFVGNVLLVPLVRRVENRKFLALKNHENMMYWLSTVDENKPSFYLKHRLQEMTHVQ